MNVLIIEDEINDYKRLINLIHEVSDTLQIPVRTEWKTGLEDLDDALLKADLVFLDIQLHKVNGIAFFKSLSRQERTFGLVILSRHSEYLQEGYKIQADRFLLKPVHSDVFLMEMLEYLPLLNVKQGGFYDEKLSARKIRYQDMIWIDSHDHKTEVHFTGGITKEISVPISYWQNKLDPQLFVSPYRGILVNLSHVTQTTDHEWILDNDIRIPVSRYRRRDVEDAWLHFQIRQI